MHYYDNAAITLSQRTCYARGGDDRECCIRPRRKLIKDHSSRYTANARTNSSAGEHDSQHPHTNRQVTGNVKEGGTKHYQRSTLHKCIDMNACTRSIPAFVSFVELASHYSPKISTHTHTHTHTHTQSHISGWHPDLRKIVSSIILMHLSM